MDILQRVELFSPDLIAGRVAELADEINRDYAGREPLMVCVLKGAYMFFADLTRRITLPLEIDFLRVSSYGRSDASSGSIRFLDDMHIPLAGRDVILVDDIVDSGLTMDFLRREISARDVNSLRIAALIDKFERREIDLRVDYAGFRLNEGYVVGYGLDFAERGRELPAIYALRRQDQA